MSDNDPPERDVKDFEFIQLCKFRIAPPDTDVPTSRQKLLTASSQYGLLMYATKQGFCVAKTCDLLAVDEQLGKERTKTVVTDVPLLHKIILNSAILMLDCSTDGKTLTVVAREMGQLDVLFYDVQAFYDKSSPPAPFTQTRLVASPSSTVVDIAWNPAFPTMMSVCLSDGSVQLMDVTDKVSVLGSLPASVGATCFCWSPKGKQLLVGKKDGTFTQYDHSMAEKRQWPCPTVLNGPHGAVDVTWQSTYVFMAAYLQTGAQPSDQPSVVMNSSNKENNTTYINFDDICYGNGETRKAQYFFHFVQKWELILTGSSTATEITIVGKNLDNKVNWEHWNLEDCSRAELPLTDDKNDSYPCGMAVDYSPQKELVLGEIKKLPACPVMYLLSTDGILIGFHLAYSHKDAIPVTAPPQQPNMAQVRKAVQGSSQPLKTALFQTPQKNEISSTGTGLTPSSSSAQTTPQMTTKLGGFGSSLASNTTGPSFQFTGLGTKPAAPPAFGLGGQKPPSFTTPATTAPASGLSSLLSQPKSTGFAFGSAPTSTVQSSAFSFVPPSSSGGITAASNKPSPQSGIFGSSLPKPNIPQSQATAFSGTPGLTSSIATPPKQEIFKTDGKSAQQPEPQNQNKGLFGASFSQNQASALNFQAQSIAQQPSSKPPPSYVTPQPSLDNGGKVPQAQPAAIITPKPSIVTQPTVIPISTPKAAPSQTIGNVDTQRSIEATVDDAFSQNIFDEIKDFEQELQNFRQRSSRNVKTVGTRDEMQTLRHDTEKMSNFLQEIKDTTKEQSREAQEQKSTCFKMFAMAEECKTKHERNSDPHYHSLLQGRSLDPASAETLKSLHQQSQQIESCVLEVDAILDKQWQEHIDKQRAEKKLHTPTGDTIYKSIRTNNMLISSQRRQLEKLEEQLKNIKLYTSTMSPNRTHVQNNIFNSSKMSPLSAVKDNTKSEQTLTSVVKDGMTPEKISRLREVLSQRKVPRVKSIQPANLSKSRIVSVTPTASSSPKTPNSQQSSAKQASQLQGHVQSPQTQQTPTGHPGMQLRIQKGFPQVAEKQASASPVMSGFGQGQTALNKGLGASTVQPQHPAATSFSGVAYFNQQQQGGLSKISSAGFGTNVVPPAAASNPALNKTSVVGVPAQSVPTVINSAASQLQSHLLYEDVTPTETDDTNDDDDDDDDYDDEDNGYEDEDEDEEETGFVAFAPVRSQDSATTGSQANTGSTKTAPAAKDLFGSKTSTVTAPASSGFSFGGPPVLGQKQMFGSTSGSGTGVFGSMATPSKGVGFADLVKDGGKDTEGTTVSTSGASVAPSQPVNNGFKFAVPASKDSSSSSEASKSTFSLGGSGTAATTIPTPASTATTSTSSFTGLFGQKSSSAAGFSFGGPAVLGQASAPSTSSTAGSGIFGSQATPSKTAAFSDLSKKDVKDANDVTSSTDAVPEEKKSLFGSTNSSTPSMFGGKSSTSAGGTFGFNLTPSSMEPGPATTLKATTSTSPLTGKAVPDQGAGGDNAATFGFTAPVTTSEAGTTDGNTQAQTTQEPSVTSTDGQKPASLFGSVSSAPTSTTSSSSGFALGSVSSSVSSSSTPTSTVGSSLFGQASQTPVVKSLFGQSDPAVTTAPATSSVFGGGASTTTAVKSLFGSSAETTTATTSLFGGGTAATTQGTSLFGSSAATATTSASAATPLFGGGASTTTASSSLFGGFGTPSSTTTPSSPFGSATTSTGGGLFGGGVSSAASSTPLFGGTNAASSSKPFGFGTTSTNSGTGGLFGSSSTPASSASSPAPFGAPSSSGSLFGSTSSANTTKPSGGLFGSSTTGSSVFGSSASTTPQGSGFGQSPSTGFGFGQSTTASTGFGQPSAFGQSAPSSGSLFGSGGGFGGLGGKPSEEKAKQNVFGTPQTFGSSGQTQNLFGSGGSTAFGSPTASPFGGGASPTSGSFTAGGQGVAAAGFGVTANQPGNTGFGGSPSFGGAPAFGSTNAFGASKPVGFGSAPSFGSSSTFGNTAGGGAGAGFSGFANTAAPSFGQLAETSSSPGFGAQAPSSPFGNSGGGFGAPASPFGGNTGGSVFGQGAQSPAFGGGGQTTGFGNSSGSTFSGNPAFSSYRG